MGDSDESSDFSARHALDCLPQAILVIDASSLVCYVNPGAEHLFGERAADLCGRPSSQLLQLVDERTGEALMDPVETVLAGTAGSADTTPEAEPLLAIPARNERLPVRLAVGAMGADAAPSGAVVAILDDDQDRMLRRAVADSGGYDPLTRLINRAEFAQRLERLLAGRAGSHALLYLDLDRFGHISERWGHAAGDYALREVTRMFSDMIRARDTFARLDADEFGVLMEHCGSAVTEQIANSLHSILVQRPLRWQDQEFDLSVSIGGVLIHPGDTRGPDDLIEIARQACDRAKTDEERPVQIDS